MTMDGIKNDLVSRSTEGPMILTFQPEKRHQPTTRLQTYFQDKGECSRIVHDQYSCAMDEESILKFKDGCLTTPWIIYLKLL